MTNLLPFNNIIIDHIENNSIHGVSNITKIGEINAHDFNQHEIQTFVKKQFPAAIPEGKYLGRVFCKFFEPFLSQSLLHIVVIRQEQTPAISNAENSVLVLAYNAQGSTIADIDLTLTLSNTNAQDWTNGRIGVYAELIDFPVMADALRRLFLTILDNLNNPVENALVIVDDEEMGLTNIEGSIDFDVSCESFELSISKNGFNNLIEEIQEGIENITEERILNTISERQLTIILPKIRTVTKDINL